MKNKKSKVAGLILRASAIAASAMPLISFAQVNPGPAAVPPPNTNVQFTTISGALCTLVNWIFTLLMILTVIFILFAAFNYLTSSGEEEKIKKANHQLLYAAIAVIIAILSRGLPFLVGQFIGAGTLPTC
ncbi:MAG TPA: hypothetical protein VMV71_00040 [Candidatus Paceibacterota bacterium]|nr:hypothetical protein [Candidatus Paceibacterota bacterium]